VTTLVFAGLGLALLLAVVVLVAQVQRRRALESLVARMFQHGKDPERTADTSGSKARQNSRRAPSCRPPSPAEHSPSAQWLCTRQRKSRIRTKGPAGARGCAGSGGRGEPRRGSLAGWPFRSIRERWRREARASSGRNPTPPPGATIDRSAAAGLRRRGGAVRAGRLRGKWCGHLWVPWIEPLATGA